MTKQQLIAKRALYEAKKVELKLDNHSAEIEEKVAKYREQLESEVASQTAKDIEKVDNYLELLDDLIAEQDANEVEIDHVEQEDTASTILSDTNN